MSPDRSDTTRGSPVMWVSLALAVLLVAAVLSFVSVEGSGDASTPRPETAERADSVAPPEEAPSVAGVQPRPTSPANAIQAEHTLHSGKVEEYARLADKAPDLVEKMKAGETKWSDLLIDLHFSETAQRIHEKCLAAFLREYCEYTISFVVEADGSGSGEIVYARALLPDDSGPSCEPYAHCMTRERIGTKLAVPEGMNGLIGHRNTQTDGNNEDAFSDPKLVRETLEALEESLRILRGMEPDGSPDWEWRVAHTEMQARVFRKMLERLEAD